ncbi:MAG TPA: hypothetical protein VM008_16200 [Phycisphaerae bacterium]|nr:hypothetical protein [Phycisphaerae bacterium]
MVTVEQIKAAIPYLTPSERDEIAKCLDDIWDEQIKRDYDSGKLDAILNEVRDDIRNDRLEEGP